MSGLLPEGFAALEPFAAHWAGETAAARARLRDNASAAEAAMFYATAQPLVEPALAYLDAQPLAAHDEAQQRLMRLLLAFTHVAMAIEVQGQDETAHARQRPHLRITRTPADVKS
jgi:hypothetical protein